MEGKDTLFLVCDVLADIIIENIQIRYMINVLKNNYFYVPERDQCGILITTLKRVWYADKGAEYLDMIKKDVSNRIAVCMLEPERHTITLDGIIHFRMKDYMEEWLSALDSCVDEYILKHEQQEFIKLLRYFVSMREPQKKIVYVNYEQEGGEYTVSDENGKKLACNVPALDRPKDINITKEDILLSRLINISPEVIVLVNTKEFGDQKLVELLRQVFVGRVRSDDVQI